MNLEQVKFLLQPETESILDSLSIDAHNHLQVATRLHKSYTSDQVHALIETAMLRDKGGKKFSRAAEMLFVRDGLEQASAEVVSTYRAAKFKQAGVTHVADMGCGIGGDSIAYAAFAQVTGIDRSAVRLNIAAHNLAVYGRSENFQPVEADLQAILPPVGANGFFFDPARRTAEGKRIFKMANYQPPISILDRWLPTVPTGGVKISPGVDYADLPAPEVASVEFISVQGEVREGMLWYGDLRTNGRCATLLPSGETLHEQPHLPETEVTEPQGWLYEPDGAVIRAHLIKELAAEIHGVQIDRSIALLTTADEAETPFARKFKIVDVFPFQLKRLKRYVREQKIGRVTVKKRGSPLDPQWLEKQLKPKGEHSATIFMTQVAGEPTVIVCNLSSE